MEAHQMSDIADTFHRFANARLSIQTDGPPNFDCGRVIVSGDVDGFRLLAAILIEMADNVASTDHPASGNGWQLVLSPRDVPQLQMDDAALSLDCYSNQP